MLNFVVGQQSICLLTGLLKYMPRNMALLVQKVGGGKKLSKYVSVILCHIWHNPAKKSCEKHVSFGFAT